MLALLYTAYVYRVQDFGDADEIRIPDNIVHVRSAVPQNGINADRAPVLSAAKMKEIREENMRLVRNIVSPKESNVENTRNDTSTSATSNNKNESKAIPVGENRAPHLNTSKITVPIEDGQSSDDDEISAEPSKVDEDPAPGNVATPNKVNAHRSRMARKNINVPQANSTHLHKKAKSSNRDAPGPNVPSDNSKTNNLNDGRSLLTP